MEELKSYASIISALFSIATLGFLLNLLRMIKDVEKEKSELLKEKNVANLKIEESKREIIQLQNQLLETRNTATINEAKAKQEILEIENKLLKFEVEKTEKWHNREVEELKRKLNKDKESLESYFEETGINIESIVTQNTRQITESIKESVEIKLSEIEEKIEKLGKLEESVNPEIYLEIGTGLMVTKEWKRAAEQFDKYIQYYPLNWEAQFSRAVSYANSRENKESNLFALRAYSEAIALFPDNSNKNSKARLFSYRAAMLKRLGRLEEAQADLIVAENLASENHEMRDIKYNFACIYAMKNDRKKLIEAVQSLKNYSGYKQKLNAIRQHLRDYFASFANDKEFLELIEIETK